VAVAHSEKAVVHGPRGYESTRERAHRALDPRQELGRIAEELDALLSGAASGEPTYLNRRRRCGMPRREKC
jgi:hypothetical protein